MRNPISNYAKWLGLAYGSDIRSSARPQKNLAVVGVAYLVLVESASGSDEHYHSKEVREANNSGPNAKASLNRAEFSLYSISHINVQRIGYL